jgi:hypothetical protein
MAKYYALPRPALPLEGKGSGGGETAAHVLSHRNIPSGAPESHIATDSQADQRE